MHWTGELSLMSFLVLVHVVISLIEPSIPLYQESQ